MKTLLVVDDEPGVRFSLETVFQRQYRVVAVENGEQAVEALRTESPDLAIVDILMPDMSGLDLLPLLKQEDPQLPVIMLSALKDVSKVVDAIQRGAAQYLTKPFDVDELRLAVRMALRNAGRLNELTALESEMTRWYDTSSIVGESRAWRETLAVAQRAAASPDTTIMLYGESGTGKELLARLIHARSPRRNAPMMPIHCAAVPEALMESELFGHEKGSFTGAMERRRGCVELADTGTLFLDEIGEMPAAMQSKLLRFLQDHEFMRVGGSAILHANVRVIAATNRDLKKGVSEGWFREDLFYRLNVVPITIPPLRDRPEDIPLLVNHYVSHFARECRGAMESVHAAAMEILCNYPWPGNIRELRNVIERAIVLNGAARELTPAHLPAELEGGAAGTSAGPSPASFPVSLQQEVRELETRLIRAALIEAGGNLSQAAVLLQTTRRILKYKIDQLGLD
ncbi:MAG: sigma-54-dependent Fis family transcriptional regulator [Kiritimatiellaeota bacterium]|nr:sigma-54-dependent Fis family transcriptional regulator [Kiritimatiellota bacterium]